MCGWRSLVERITQKADLQEVRLLGVDRRRYEERGHALELLALHIEPLQPARVQTNQSLAPATLAGDCADHRHCRPLELLPREALPQDQAAPALSNVRLNRNRSVHQQRAVDARPGYEHGELAVLCRWPGEGALERHLVFIVGVPLIAHQRPGAPHAPGRPGAASLGQHQKRCRDQRSRLRDGRAQTQTTRPLAQPLGTEWT